MTTFIRCNGCQEELSRLGTPVAVQGEGVNGNALRNGPLRAGQVFHWCTPCARAAFAAVAELHRRP